MQSRVLEIPTGVKVRTLAEFRDASLGWTPRSCTCTWSRRAAQGRRRNDFASWIDEQLGLSELAAAVARTNPFPFGLEEVRRRLGRALR